MIRIIFSSLGPFTSSLAPICPLARGYLLQQVHVQGVSFQHPVFLNDFSPLARSSLRRRISWLPGRMPISFLVLKKSFETTSLTTL